MVALKLNKENITAVLGNFQNATLMGDRIDYHFDFIYPKDNATEDNTVCMVRDGSTVVVELAFDTVETIFYDTLGEISCYDLTLIVNTFHEFMRNAITSNLRANIIDSIQRVIDSTEKEAWMNIMKVIAHEIINSLTPIYSLANTTKTYFETDNLDKNDYDDIRLSLDTIMNRSQHLQTFVEQYRQLTMLPNPVKSTQNLYEIIQGIEQSFSAEFHQKNIVFQNLIPENIKRPINFFLKDFEKLLYLFPVAMIIFLIINWNNKTLGEKLFFIGLILLNIYEVYYKKKSEATNDQI